MDMTDKIDTIQIDRYDRHIDRDRHVDREKDMGKQKDRINLTIVTQLLQNTNYKAEKDLRKK